MILLLPRTATDIRSLHDALLRVRMADKDFDLFEGAAKARLAEVHDAISELRNEIFLYSRVADEAASCREQGMPLGDDLICSIARGFDRLGVPELARHMRDLQAVLGGVLSGEMTQEQGQTREEALQSAWPALKEAALTVAWSEAIDRALSPTWVSDAEFDAHYLEAILASEAYEVKSQQTWQFELSSSAQFETGIAWDAEQAGVDLGFTIWRFLSQPQAVMCSNQGPLLLPVPKPQPPFDITRWPDGAVLFRATGAIKPPPAPSDDMRNADRFVAGTEAIEDLRVRISRWTGGAIAYAVAAVLRPRDTYVMYQTLAGYGVGTRQLVSPILQALACALVLAYAIARQDLLGAVPAMFAGPAGGLVWVLDLGQILLALLVTLLMLSRAIAAVAQVHGTLQRAKGRQLVHGSSNLPDTGQDNLLYRLLTRS